MDEEASPKRRSRRTSQASLRICVTCRWKGMDTLGDPDIRPGEHLHDLALSRARPDQRDRVEGIVCLTHCLNACNAVVMQRGKPPLLMTQMAPDEATADALLDMLDRFGKSDDGVVAGVDVPDAIPLARPLVPPRKTGRTNAE